MIFRKKNKKSIKSTIQEISPKIEEQRKILEECSQNKEKFSEYLSKNPEQISDIMGTYLSKLHEVKNKYEEKTKENFPEEKYLKPYFDASEKLTKSLGFNDR